MTYQEIRSKFNMPQQELADLLGIPRRTIQNWDEGITTCRQYLVDLIAYRLENDDFTQFEPAYYTMKELRLATGMYQKDFAEYFGFSVGILRNWESNQPYSKYLLNLMEYKLLKENIIN